MAVEWWREGYGVHRREKEKNSWLVAAGRLGFGAGRVPVHVRLDHPHALCAHTTLPRSIGPKPGPVKPLKLGNKLLNLGLCAPSLPSAGPSPKGPNRGKGAGDQGAASVPRGGEEGMTGRVAGLG